MKLDFKVSYFFPPMTRILGYLIMAIGWIALYTNGWQVFLIPLIGFAIAFSTKGVLLDTQNNSLKEYNSFFFIKFGSWRSLTQFPHITVLSVTEKTTVGSHTTLVSSSSKQMVYRITLLSQDHYKKIVIQQLNDQEKANAEAERLADLLNLEKVIFSPGSY